MLYNKDLAIALYESVRAEDEPRVLKAWHASSIAECPRTHYYKRIGVKPLKTMTGALLLRFQAGHIIEGFIRPHILKQYPKLKSNVRLNDKELDLTGEYDNYDPETKQLIEIKSVHPWAFKHLQKEGKPYLHHEYQQHAYKILLKEVEHITYVYIALDGQIEVFTTKPSEVIETNVRKRVELLNKAWEAQEPPLCLCGDESNPLYKGQMQYCDYKTDTDCCSLELLEKFKEEFINDKKSMVAGEAK